MKNVVSAKDVNALVPFLFPTCTSVLSLRQLFLKKLCWLVLFSFLSISFLELCSFLTDFFCIVETTAMLAALWGIANANVCMLSSCCCGQIVSYSCGAGYKVRGSQKSLGFIIWGISVPNFVAIRSSGAKIFNPKPKMSISRSHWSDLNVSSGDFNASFPHSSVFICKSTGS